MVKRPKLDDGIVPSTLIFNEDGKEEEKLSTRRTQSMIIGDAPMEVAEGEDGIIRKQAKSEGQTCELSIISRQCSEQNRGHLSPDRTGYQGLDDGQPLMH